MSNVDEEALTLGSDRSSFAGVGRKRRRGVRVATAAAIALGLAVSGGAVAGATTSSSGATGATTPAGQPPGSGSPPAAMGTVKSVGDGTFALTTQDGTAVTVDVSGTTTYLDPGVTSPTIANVTVGEHVVVFGTESSDTVTATSVAIGNPPSGKGGPGNGKGGPGGMPPVGAESASTSS